MAKEIEKNPRIHQKKPGEGSVQAFLEIAEIRDNTLIMKDGSLRGVLMVSSINFDLKSMNEQESIIAGYQNFLNSLNFPIQILMRSKKLELGNYMNRLKVIKETEKSPFILNQLNEYTNFVGSLLEVSEIMDKKFYIIVPFYPTLIGATGVKKVGLFEKLGNAMNPTYKIQKKEEEFRLHHAQLSERIEMLVNELGELGVGGAQLTTKDLVELFYEIYNNETAQREKLIEVSEITTSVVE
ncbi:hypothetical protein HGB13_01050 [bacterium]|nr:hypothetical protein [bacterium]